MTPEEIIADATDKAKNYPGDRLRLTGAELLALVQHCTGRETKLRAALKALVGAANERVLYGHNDTCSHELSEKEPFYPCSCGHSELAAEALAACAVLARTP